MAGVTTAAYWDDQAPTFDDDPDHGLREPAVRAAWEALLLPRIPEAAAVADLGCGTGSLSVLLGQAGHRVSAIDIAPQMIAAARAKATAAGVAAEFMIGDAAHPPWQPESFDVVLSRHVLWAMPDRDDALRRWTRLLRPGGLLLLVEGYWSTGAGITVGEARDLVLGHRADVAIERLDDPALWGGPVTDERYLLTSRR